MLYRLTPNSPVAWLKTALNRGDLPSLGPRKDSLLVLHKFRTATLFAICATFSGVVCAAPLMAQTPAIRSAADAPSGARPADSAIRSSTYADVADLADAAGLVARVEIRKVAPLDDTAAPGLTPGWARIYVEARTVSLLMGPQLGETVRYLADVRLDARGKVPKMRKSQALVFATPVNGRPGELRLVAPDAQLLWTPELEAQARSILTEMVSPSAPPRITGLREVLHVPGNLAGEGETQLFLATENGAPVSITVVRRPGQSPAWGVSFSEIVDQSARAPAPQTLAWYRLACSLPASLPPAAVLAGTAREREIAAEDFLLVRRDLGPCDRSRGPVH